ncbi:MAG: pseudouridine-5'-phosphate glycosidase [Selenomonadaceae bacterium]|nr:pseudouridine-5'-phosphate glycosidase [Selenomonadaceae bacterium]
MKISEYIEYSAEVKQALDDGRPVVAIETAGTFEAFAYPDNKDLANLVMDRVRKEGAVPAYIAVINGKVKVGLESAEVEYLASHKEPLVKASRRDISILLTKQMDALTAVAATMMVADMTGIKVVTGGGIGGVHRGAETSFDISADLEEFCKSNVVVVCSGAKSILDLKLTLEYLETHAVTIAGYRTKELPAYMAVHSGCKLDYSLDSPTEAAKCYRIKNELGVPGGMLIANPIDENYAVDSELMNRAVDKAVAQAAAEGITGKVITKYIMGIVKKELGGDSKEASFHMNVDNAGLAAAIAKEIAE